MFADLHIHSLHSDGTDTVAEIVERAAKNCVGAIALTDHDTVAGTGEFVNAAKKHGIKGIPGVEISTSLNRRRIHVLGYFIDTESKALLKFLKTLAEARTENTKLIFDKLCSLGLLKYSWEAVLAYTAGSQWIHSSHVFRAMMRDGCYSSWEQWSDFFYRYFGKDSIAYVDIDIFSAADAIDIIRSAGGIPVLAHPKLIGEDGLIDGLVAKGLAGMEVYYPAHGKNDRERYLALCRKYDLLPTGGTDWHGKLTEWEVDIGDCGMEAECFSRLSGLKGCAGL